jgi:hypothetical protein
MEQLIPVDIKVQRQDTKHILKTSINKIFHLTSMAMLQTDCIKSQKGRKSDFRSPILVYFACYVRQTAGEHLPNPAILRGSSYLEQVTPVVQVS